jgi:hypothetical protein
MIFDFFSTAFNSNQFSDVYFGIITVAFLEFLIIEIIKTKLI